MVNFQVIKSPTGDDMVVIAKRDFDDLLARIADLDEDAADAAIFDARMADLTETSKLPAEVSMAILKGENRLRAIRKYAELSQAEVAQMANKSQGYISDLESGRREITDAAAQGLASVLDVPVEWLKGR